MRRCILAFAVSLSLIGTAFAADFGRPRGNLYGEVVPAFDWSGVYLGAHVGWGAARTSYNLAGGPFEQDANGFLGGGSIGVNYQADNWVVGFEGEFTGTGISSTVANPLLLTNAYKADTNWMAALTMRAGYDFGGLMFYAKGGVAWIDQSFAWQNLTDSAKADRTRIGWTAGGGFELALNTNWSAKLEYMFVRTDAATANFHGTVPDFSVPVGQDTHTFKFGLAYRFVPEPITARLF